MTDKFPVRKNSIFITTYIDKHARGRNHSFSKSLPILTDLLVKIISTGWSKGRDENRRFSKSFPVLTDLPGVDKK